MTSSLFSVATRNIKLGVVGRPAGVIIAVEGTAYPGCPGQPIPILNNGTGWWAGFSSGLVGGVTNLQDGLWDSYCVGYKAPTLPMWPGVQEARNKAVDFLLWYQPRYYAAFGDYAPTVFTGYSQGSMGTDQVWVIDILQPNGRLHFMADYVYRMYQFGHIFRTPGVAWGNALVGAPQSIIADGVESGGIGTTMDITNAQVALLAPDGQPIQHSCANAGDIYTCCPVGTNPWTNPAPEGKVGKLFEQVIMQPTMTDILSLATVLEEPIGGIIELFNTMKFFAAGTNAPHYQYYPQMLGCINDCYQLGLSLPHSP